MAGWLQRQIEQARAGIEQMEPWEREAIRAEVALTQYGPRPDGVPDRVQMESNLTHARPVRIQLKRTKGWRLQEQSLALNGLPAVRVARPGPYGNPYRPDVIQTRVFLCWDFAGIAVTGPRPNALYDCLDRGRRVRRVHAEIAVLLYRDLIELCRAYDPAWFENWIAPLKGKNLACWCAPDQPCHADVLLELAGDA